MTIEMAETTLEVNCPETDCRRTAFDTLSLRTQAGSAGSPRTIDAPVVGIVAAFRDGTPMVDFRANSAGALLAARSTVTLRETDAGREVVLTFEEGDPER